MAPARHIPEICFSDDLVALEAAAEVARSRCNAAEADIARADDAGDMAAYDRADAEFTRADDELLLIERRIDELEEDAAIDEMRATRRGFWASVL